MVKASELIKKLSEIIESEGDLPVFHWNDWLDFPVDDIRVEDEESSGKSKPYPKRVVLDGMDWQ